MNNGKIDHHLEHHLGFVKEIVAEQKVWGLKGKLGWAVAQSNIYESTEVYLFWQSKSLAQACAKEGWESYLASAIPLSEFLEDWCIAIFDEQNTIGINWDFYQCGQELESLSLAKDILATHKENSVDEIQFSKYSAVNEFENWINNLSKDELSEN